MNDSLPPKWRPRGLWLRLRRTVRRPADLWLALQIGWFIWRLPASLAAANLGRYLDGLQRRPRPPAGSAPESAARILRLSEPWLRLGPWRSRNTCYTRAFVLYRFMATDDPLRFHFGVDVTTLPEDRRHGHAWITVNGAAYGMEDPTVPDRCQLIYSHPPSPTRPN